MTATDLRSYPFQVTDPFLLPAELAWLRASDPVTKVRVATGDEVWLVSRTGPRCRAARSPAGAVASS